MTSGRPIARLARSSSSAPSRFRSIDDVSAGSVRILGGALAKNAREARVRVLDVEHGILGRLLLGELEIEIELAVGLAEQKEKSHDVGADLVDQLVERDVGGLARGHFDFFAGARERDELVDDRADGRDVVAERLDRGDDLLMLGDVIGAEDVDDQVEAALELLDVIGDVGRAISRLLVGAGAHEHRVLGKSERLAAQPDGAVLLEGEAGARAAP